ncbi:MAG: chromosome partitioning ATPase [Parvularculaceae bacterium]
MSLIEKAGGVFEKAADGVPRAVQPEPLRTVEPSQFDIDLTQLAAHGFYTPADRASRLALEMRAIKRKLLRRTGLRNASGDPRLAKKGGRQRNLILVTSTRPGEGKTFFAINLALSLAYEEEMDVLLVDADAPRPKIRAHFGLPESPGLTNRIANPAVSLDAVTMRARQAPLSILGEGTPAGRTADLFSSAEAQRVFTEMSMRKAGRVVIIDAPPVLATAESIMLARHVDEVVFVVEADATPQAAVETALDEILDANPNVSLVLNRCLIGPGSAYYGSYGDYERKAEPPPSGGDRL